MPEAGSGSISRLMLTILFMLVGCYAGAFALNSATGGYWVEPDTSAPDPIEAAAAGGWVVHWQPRWGYRSRVRSDALGLFFAPLIALDRLLFHPSLDLATPEGVEALQRAVAEGRIHPDDPLQDLQLER